MVHRPGAVPAGDPRRAGQRAARPGRDAHREAGRFLRPPDRFDHRQFRGRRPRASPRRRDPAGLQDRRHLRRGVHGLHAISLQLLRRGNRSRAARTPCGDRSRQRAQPDRPGHRVRLRLLSRGFRAFGRRLRDHDGQLQSRDRLHRLRHQRPALLRAAHGRGRARDRCRRKGSRPGRRRRRPARRPDPARTRRCARTRRSSHRGHLPVSDPSRRGPRRVRQGAGCGRAHGPSLRHRLLLRRGTGRRRRDRLSRAGPAELRARRARDGDRLRRDVACRIT